MTIIVHGADAIIPVEVTAKLSESAVQSIVEDVAASARLHWINLAKNDTSSFRLDYIQGIQEVEVQGRTAVIALVGEIPHLLEDGDDTDLRDILLGPNVSVVQEGGGKGKRQNEEGGFYRPIPFRHTTPGRKGAPRGATSGREMTSVYKGHPAVENAKKMGAAVYRAARRLKPTVRSSVGMARGTALRTGRIRSGLPKGQKIPLLRPHHKTDIFQGMIRVRGAYEKAIQSQYMTFRTISTDVPEGWIRHIEPRHYADDVNTFVQRILPAAFEAYMEGQ